MLKQVSSDDWYIVLWLSDTNEDSNDNDHGSDDIIEDNNKDSSNSFNYCGHDYSVVTYA